MKTIDVPKSQFKPKVFAYLRGVEAGEHEIRITDHGKPVVRITAIQTEEEEDLDTLRGLIRRFDEPLEPPDATWEALA